jgi:hypothetical protein
VLGKNGSAIVVPFRKNVPLTYVDDPMDKVILLTTFVALSILVVVVEKKKVPTGLDSFSL